MRHINKIGVTLAAQLFFVSSAAHASELRVFCITGANNDGGKITEPFEISAGEMDKVNAEWLTVAQDSIAGCYYWQESVVTSYPNKRRVDWVPSSVKPAGPLKTITLLYKDGEIAGYGYRSASIKLSYRFLLCADEIQIAYGLDRKSQEHSDQYIARSGKIDYDTPSSEPAVPLALPINLSIVRKITGTFVAKLRDANAGESLGMGCFTGQTRKIGTLAALLGAKPTKTQIQDYLNSLTLRGQDTDGGARLDAPLTNPDEPAPPVAKPSGAKLGAAPRKPAPRKR